MSGLGPIALSVLARRLQSPRPDTRGGKHRARPIDWKGEDVLNPEPIEGKHRRPGIARGSLGW